MKFAVNVPNFGVYADAVSLVDLARRAEQAGWDGFFLWDHILVADNTPVGDPWVLLAAVATATTNIRLGPMVTPLPRRRPWKLAREVTTLDHLSGGRVVLGVGIGFPPEVEFGAFGEPIDERTRADILDEGLEVITGMWSGLPFSFEGRFYRIAEFTFLPPPVQQPRVPIWVAGMWPHRRPFRRAARYDGVVPIKVEDGELAVLQPQDVGAVIDYVDRYRTVADRFEVSAGAPLPESRAEAIAVVAEYAAAGATWLHVGPGFDEDPVAFRARVAAGPPRR